MTQAPSPACKDNNLPPPSLDFIPEKCHFPGSQQTSHLPCSERDLSLPPYVLACHLPAWVGSRV